MIAPILLLGICILGTLLIGWNCYRCGFADGRREGRYQEWQRHKGGPRP